jgi:hypothetical protein
MPEGTCCCLQVQTKVSKVTETYKDFTFELQVLNLKGKEEKKTMNNNTALVLGITPIPMSTNWYVPKNLRTVSVVLASSGPLVALADLMRRLNTLGL